MRPRPEAHDRQRRKQGAFAAAIEGLKRAATTLSDGTELTVSSVLIRKRREQLDAMPELLKRIGIKRWVVTALVKLGMTIGSAAPSANGKTSSPTSASSDRPGRCDAGIDFLVDDEFDGLASEDANRTNSRLVRIRRLVNPDGVYRLVPDGRCSKGADILKPLTDQTPRWDPKTMDAATFLAQL